MTLDINGHADTQLEERQLFLTDVDPQVDSVMYTHKSLKLMQTIFLRALRSFPGSGAARASYPVGVARLPAEGHIMKAVLEIFAFGPVDITFLFVDLLFVISAPRGCHNADSCS